MTSSSFLCHFFGLIFLGSLVRIRFFSGVESKFISTQNEVSNRPPQDVDVRAVLDFEIPCHRPETTALYPRRFRMSRKPGSPRRLWGQENGFKDSGRRGHQRLAEAWYQIAIRSSMQIMTCIQITVFCNE